ncbi:Oidioi.mRNA.OKI2018_I69.PAR.g10068.t1.cds [Oikopleura dioica]|uniref:Oidioi.mRNA.OKI2018_I69.PAR.g10068.t1.cds n=1 Tax=Oikopleura dioica TaxID=34765 RepID=A0ABN7RT09_OIKDI|nr:Oidioi.mRNA.OKI2018_I69.PAR.g10068.t1.cds [Oikopleura dioica]
MKMTNIALSFPFKILARGTSHLQTPTNDPASESFNSHVDGILDQNQSREFQKMTQEEKLFSLEEIFKKMDADENEEVDEDELQQWMRYVENRFVFEDTDAKMEQMDLDEDGMVSMEEFKEAKYNPERIYKDPSINAATAMYQKKKDLRRFAADTNEDRHLSRNEFTHYLHPTGHVEMMEVIALETLEDLDKNSDGYIDLAEYLGDIGARSFSDKPDQEEETILPMGDDEFDEEPNTWKAPGIDDDWIENEKRIFNKERDIDGDGFLNMAEVMLWMNPPDFDVIQSEADYLIATADRDGSSTLSKQEVLKAYDAFIESPATHWGSSLLHHDS